MAAKESQDIKELKNKMNNKPNKQNKKQNINQTGKKQNQKKNFAKKENIKSQPKKRTDFKKSADYKNKSNKSKKKPINETPLKIIPLGGLDEIGKNMTVYEYENDAFIVDCGMSFPDEETPGVDAVIPDFSYVLKIKDKIRGLVLTHGHEDHIGAIPYLLSNINVPIFGTNITVALVTARLKERSLEKNTKLHTVQPGQKIKLGVFDIEFINVNHSIPGAVGIAVTTPCGVIVQTGDFKIDTTPIDGNVIDLARFAQLGREGVLALLCDSTNAERPGFTPTEKTVGESFSNLFKSAEGHRIIVATFSSNIHRVQQIIDEAVRCKRKVAVSGRSMINVVAIAAELGYLNVPDGVLIDLSDLKNYELGQTVIITTGSQGEPLSALHRMAFSDHKSVEIVPGDFIIISATPIPGNERLVSKVINELMKHGANVIYEKMYDVHVSGHACQEEIKLMLSITNPKFYMPVHGEQKHLFKNANLAKTMGIDKNNIMISSIGDVVEFTSDSMKCTQSVTAGRVLVDGLGVGDVGSIVLRDRKHLAEDGIIVIAVTMEKASGMVVSGPEVISRGFVFVKESEELVERAADIAADALEKCYLSGISDRNSIKIKMRDAVSKFVYGQTKRSPMILPIIMDI